MNARRIPDLTGSGTRQKKKNFSLSLSFSPTHTKKLPPSSFSLRIDVAAAAAAAWKKGEQPQTITKPCERERERERGGRSWQLRKRKRRWMNSPRFLCVRWKGEGDFNENRKNKRKILSRAFAADKYWRFSSPIRKIDSLQTRGKREKAKKRDGLCAIQAKTYMRWCKTMEQHFSLNTRLTVFKA